MILRDSAISAYRGVLGDSPFFPLPHNSKSNTSMFSACQLSHEDSDLRSPSYVLKLHQCRTRNNPRPPHIWSSYAIWVPLSNFVSFKRSKNPHNNHRASLCIAEVRRNQSLGSLRQAARRMRCILKVVRRGTLNNYRCWLTTSLVPKESSKWKAVPGRACCEQQVSSRFVQGGPENARGCLQLSVSVARDGLSQQVALMPGSNRNTLGFRCPIHHLFSWYWSREDFITSSVTVRLSPWSHTSNQRDGNSANCCSHQPSPVRTPCVECNSYGLGRTQRVPSFRLQEHFHTCRF